jgi:hypothetical protein
LGFESRQAALQVIDSMMQVLQRVVVNGVRDLHHLPVQLSPPTARGFGASSSSYIHIRVLQVWHEQETNDFDLKGSAP